ncbi:hypothetical protein R9X47_22710 [Wukongibacter baidiensis]|uniref:hypothetical protein n=1 Tax=Wukongibacter baidiensis TaxID=1723361 RepID=UPI003D7FBBAE
MNYVDENGVRHELTVELGAEKLGILSSIDITDEGHGIEGADPIDFYSNHH